jgi:hypothetical protein
VLQPQQNDDLTFYHVFDGTVHQDFRVFTAQKSYQLSEQIFTSAAAKSIFASPCFIEVDKSFVKPKSNRIGWNGGFLLTRKFPTGERKYKLMYI